MKRLKVLALVHANLVPPPGARPEEAQTAPWRAEYDVVQCLTELGHDVHVLGVRGELNPIRQAVDEWKPDVAFNLLEAFDEVATWDQNVVGYLELLRVKYTGCNARGLLLARDKALAKKLLSYHRIRVAEFAIAARGRVFRRPKKLDFPLFVKSLTLDASIGISQASVVENEDKLQERVRFVHESIGTDALVERYIEGRELYVGIMGNARMRALPIWELSFEKMPEPSRKIATERLKWSLTYQKKHGIVSGPARELAEAQAARIQNLCRRVYSILCLSGYARIDLRLAESGEVFVIEANPNPQIARGEDFADAAQAGGMEYGPLLQQIVKLGLAWEPSRAG